VKIAMIGTGYFAHRHLTILTSEPNIQVVGHVATTLEKAMRACQRWGGRAYTSCRDLLEHETVDAAWICVPPGAHGALEETLIECGIPFFVEKPLAVDRQVAEVLAEAIAARNITAGVGYNWRAMDTIAEVRQTLADHPARMVVGTWYAATPPPVWWRHQATSGGQFIEQATHLLDLSRFLVGEASVTAAMIGYHERPAYPDADVGDVSSALLCFDTGAIGLFSATCLLERATAVQLQFICDGILITVTEESVHYVVGLEQREVGRGNDPIWAEDRAFLDAVRRNDPRLLICSYADALLTHRLCCDIADKSFLCVSQKTKE
jgi:myo-inositol 2-dehydrogenase / D-chiro-inositol 1-dehydrogenase